MKTKFKIGDILTGIKLNIYCYTNKNSTVKVTNLKPRPSSSLNYITVKILTQSEYADSIGREHIVLSKYFVLVKAAKVNNWKKRLKR